MPATFEILDTRGLYIASGNAVEGAGTAIYDVRGGRHNDKVFLWWSGSGDGPTAGGSAVFTVQHSHDKTSWTNILQRTAVKGTVATAVVSGGYYDYLRINMDAVYSAAQTGTGSVWVFAQTQVQA
jgi:hypothetical protein